MSKKMTVILDPELHKALRHLSVDLGVSFQKMAVRALAEFLERHRPAGKKTQRRR